MDSYRQWQISQSDCEISCNCGKTSISRVDDCQTCASQAVYISQLKNTAKLQKKKSSLDAGWHFHDLVTCEWKVQVVFFLKELVNFVCPRVLLSFDP